MRNAYTEPNREWRETLTDLARGLSQADVARPAGGPGWTVGGLLGHLAFWDRRALVLLERWKKDGISESPMDVDVVNDTMKPFLNALTHREVVRLCVDSAAAIDAAIDGLDPALLAKVEAEGKPVKLNRGVHRQHHIEQIRKALQ